MFMILFDQLSHCGVRPYKCEQCGKEFLRRNHLGAHLLTVHGTQPPPVDRHARRRRNSLLNTEIMVPRDTSIRKADEEGLTDDSDQSPNTAPVEYSLFGDALLQPRSETFAGGSASVTGSVELMDHNTAPPSAQGSSQPRVLSVNPVASCTLSPTSRVGTAASAFRMPSSTSPRIFDGYNALASYSPVKTAPLNGVSRSERHSSAALAGAPRAVTYTAAAEPAPPQVALLSGAHTSSSAFAIGSSQESMMVRQLQGLSVT